MKRTIFVLFALALICLGAGCVSSGKDALVSERDPVALVSVASNLEINWRGEDPVDPKNTGLLAQRARRQDQDQVVASTAEGFINAAEKLIRDCWAGSGVITLADPVTVLHSRAYADGQVNKYQTNKKMVSPGGYRLIDYRDKNFHSALEKETGIQRSIFVEFNFTMAIANGFGKNGTCKADVEMTVFILDTRGKTLYRKTLVAGSRDTIKVASGVYSEAGLMELLESAIMDLCYDFLDEFSY